MTSEHEDAEPKLWSWGPGEFVVRQWYPPGFTGPGGLSLRECSECHALVVEDSMPGHLSWHEKDGTQS